jgi:hypothetical protein
VPVEKLAHALAEKGMRCSPAPYYLVPESHTLLHRSSSNESAEPMRAWELAASRYHYSSEMCPNAKIHVARTIRWMWSEHLNEQDVDNMGQIINETLAKYRRNAA